jgi:hypothetical protein
MFLQPTPITPVIIEVVPPPTPEVSVVNVIVDALGLTGVIIVAAIVCGCLLGMVLIAYKRWRERREPDETHEGIRLDLSSR